MFIEYQIEQILHPYIAIDYLSVNKKSHFFAFPLRLALPPLPAHFLLYQVALIEKFSSLNNNNASYCCC